MLGAKSPLMRERITEVITTNFSHPPTGRFKLLQQQIQSRTETFVDRAENETAWNRYKSFLFVNEILFGVHSLPAVKIEDRHMWCVIMSAKRSQWWWFYMTPLLYYFPVNLMNYLSHYQTSSRRNNSLLAHLTAVRRGHSQTWVDEEGGGVITFNWLQLLTSGLAGYKLSNL